MCWHRTKEIITPEINRLGRELEVTTDNGKILGSFEVIIGAVVWFAPKPDPETAVKLENFLSNIKALRKITSFAGAFIQDGSVGLRFEDPAQAQAYVTRHGGILELELDGVPMQYSLELVDLGAVQALGAPQTLPAAAHAAPRAPHSYPASASGAFGGPRAAVPWAVELSLCKENVW